MSGYQDSNLGPPAPKAGALTGLRYTPKAVCKVQTRCFCAVSELRVQRYCFFLNLANFIMFFFCLSSFIIVFNIYIGSLHLNIYILYKKAEVYFAFIP